ncbi:MAG: glycogen debranching N-terminal domain-containing protein [Solirubrobacteraceae bacterium]
MPENGSVNVLDGNTFVVGDRMGDLTAESGREHGFFSEDTRYVSHWVLHVNGARLSSLGFDQDVHYAAQFFLTPRVAPGVEAPSSVMRRRLVDRAWIEEITVVNHRPRRSAVHVELDVDSDFADLFEVKGGRVTPRKVRWRASERSLVLEYERGKIHRSVTITASKPAAITRSGFSWEMALARGEVWRVEVRITPHATQPGTTFPKRVVHGHLDGVQDAKAVELRQWLADAPELEAENGELKRTYRTSLTDLAALRLQPDLREPATLPAAGLPWFMALFGRDSLITSFQALPYLPALAAATLRMLAARQAHVRDDFHEQEPGKILHELRLGELTATRVLPHSPYFGSADATPLFVVLLDEYHRWSGDDALVRELEPNARAALAWIAESGDADGDGYVEYSCRNHTGGLVNQCWKDSWNAIQFADSTLARGAIATCELQGYAYDARRRAARLAREVWADAGFAEQLEAAAARLREQFRRDYWMAERGAFALALDGDKRQVDSLTSNIGHLLWSGIVDDDQAAITAEQLLEEQLYSGWGVRTLGSGEAGYNPLGYHTGTVWPHENSLIVAGLARYGHRDAARTIGSAILAAAPHFECRLPEAFAGYPAALTAVPVAFPTASRPQAWATGAPLLLLSTLLDLQPGFDEAHTHIPGSIGLTRLRSARRSA